MKQHTALFLSSLLLMLSFGANVEPKSGSSTTGEWAWGVLVASCLYIKSLYGKDSCQYWTDKPLGHMLFEPTSASGEDPPCSCNNVKMWVIKTIAPCADVFARLLNCPQCRRSSLSLLINSLMAEWQREVLSLCSIQMLTVSVHHMFTFNRGQNTTTLPFNLTAGCLTL